MATARKTWANGNRGGKSLQARAVVADARKVPDRVIAIVQPVEAMFSE